MLAVWVELKKQWNINLSISSSEYLSPLIQTVRATIETHGMFTNGDRVLVGVSGGPDSIALLDVLCGMAPELGITLGVAHLNHGLRGDQSDEDARFSAAVATERHLPFFSDRANVEKFHRRHGYSIEDAGRRLRYTFYNRVAQKHHWDKIALGHHLDDNAESVLMFLLRGSGLQGLSGIPPVRNKIIVRPLIECPRTEIMTYLQCRGLDYRIDASNLNVRYRRNRIRHQLIPQLRAYNPRITHSLAKLADIVRADNQWLETISRQWFDSWAINGDENEIRLPLTELGRIPLAARRRLYRRAFDCLKGDLRRFSYDHVAAIGRLVRRGHAGKGIDLPGNIRVTMATRHIVFRRIGAKGGHGRATPEERIPYRYILPAPGKVGLEAIGATLICTPIRQAPGADIRSSDKRTVYINAEKAPFPMVIRSMQPGDRFQPLGVNGTQKIKKYFIDHKVDRNDRYRYPVVLSGNRIIWLAGQRIDEKVKVNRATGKVLKLEFFLP